MTSIETLLDQLHGVRKVAGGWEACCPAHEDSTPSLSIREGKEGRILLYDHAGCATPAVVAALGLTMKDIAGMGDRHTQSKLGEIVATYDYVDEAGQVLFQVCRFVPKTFRQRHRDGAGDWVWGLQEGEYARSSGGDWYRASERTPADAERRHFPAVRRVLYRLPAVLEAVKIGMTLWVVEGEKDVAAMREIGAIATCNPMGAGKWRAEYSQAMRGARVHIVADKDRDEKGLKHAREVAASLRGVAASVCILEAAQGKDAADHVAAGLGLSDFVEASDSPPAPPKPVGPSAETTISNRSYHLTDVGNGERFVAHHAHFARHVPGQGWLAYRDDGRFVEDPAAIRRLAVDTIRSMYAQAANLDDSDRRHALAAWAHKSEAMPRVEAMLAAAQIPKEASAMPNELNADPMLLNAPNGVVDLKTAALLDHDPALLMTQCTGAPYEPQAGCPLWMAHLRRVFDGRQELIDFLQVLIGYAATGMTVEQKLVIFYGSGANGKSVTTEILRAALGTYADSADFSTFTARDRRDHGPRDDLARLVGVRLVTASEGPQGARLDESIIKAATGGEEIVCRALYKGTFAYRPQFQIILSTNHKPRIHGGDYAIWRRVLLLPFDVRISDQEKDEHMSEKLRAELPGILAWIVRGALRWGNEGLKAPAEVKAATQAYHDDEDLLADFLEAECTIDTSLSTTVGALQKAYNEWAQHDEEGGGRKIGNKVFREMLLERGFKDLGLCPATRRRLVGGLSLSASDSQESFTAEAGL